LSTSVPLYISTTEVVVFSPNVTNTITALNALQVTALVLGCFLGIPIAGIVVLFVLRAFFRTPGPSQVERALERHLVEGEKQRLGSRIYYSPDTSEDLIFGPPNMHRLALTNT